MVGHLSGKLVALIAIAACLVLGVIGLVLPLIPGLLFLAIAVAIVARHSPRARRRLRQHPRMSRYLDLADGFLDSDIATKLKLAALYCAKALVEGAAAAVAAFRALVR